MDKCCEGITDHILDCINYKGIDPVKHNAELVTKEPERAMLRALQTSEHLRKQAIATSNGNAGSLPELR